MRIGIANRKYFQSEDLKDTERYFIYVLASVMEKVADDVLLDLKSLARVAALS